jgi:outer membrane protein OmpA-like peptidoglycan-associated protein
MIQRLPMRSLALVILAGSALLPAVHSGEPPAGNVVSDKEIERALSPEPRTRSLTRGITIKAREEEKGKDEGKDEEERRATIDLRVPFELNSSRLQPTAIEQLRQLQSALQSAALHNSRFMIAGHTDGTGNAAHNRELSMRRAEAVKQFLVTSGIGAARLDTAGFGAAQLLTPNQPANPANRRVEIRNIGELP